MGQAVRGDARYPESLDGPAACRGEQRVSRKGDCIAGRDGGSWTLRQAMSPVWRAGSTHPLRRQGNELLRPMPDAWKSPRGSRPVPSSRIGLATDIGGIGSALPTRRAEVPPKKVAANALRDFWYVDY